MRPAAAPGDLVGVVPQNVEFLAVSKTVSSRFADRYHIATWSPAAMGTPFSSVSTVARRTNDATGELHSAISTTAASMRPGRSSRRSRRWSGNSVMPQPERGRVPRGVDPGDDQRGEERDDLVVRQPLAVDFDLGQGGDQVVAGFARFSASTFCPAPSRSKTIWAKNSMLSARAGPRGRRRPAPGSPRVDQLFAHALFLRHRPCRR